MKKIKIIIALLIAYQIGNSQLIDSNYRIGSVRDTCTWDKVIDTIRVEYVIIAEDYGMVYKLSCGHIVRTYEKENCKYIWSHKTKNNKIFIEGVDRRKDIIMYRMRDGAIVFL